MHFGRRGDAGSAEERHFAGVEVLLATGHAEAEGTAGDAGDEEDVLGFEAERGAGADLHLVELERAGVEALDHEPEGAAPLLVVEREANVDVGLGDHLLGDLGHVGRESRALEHRS